jgi:hypothetical protein
MVRSIWLGIIVLLLAVALPGCVGFYRYQRAACKQRGAAFDARVEKLRREARERLVIGAKKEVIIQFFADQGVPLTFVRLGEATGTAAPERTLLRVTGVLREGLTYLRGVAHPSRLRRRCSP